MQCARCAGMEVPELLSEGGTRVVAFRCIHCGDLMDRVIMRNRQRRRLPKPTRARTPIFEYDRRQARRPFFA